MAVYKEEKTGTWRVIYRYTDWTGEKKQTQKRGFQTKREAQAWEREQLRKATADLDMTFKSFVEQYTADMKTRIKENTWATKEHIIRSKLLPYFGKLKMCNITAQQIITWQNDLLNYKDEKGKAKKGIQKGIDVCKQQLDDLDDKIVEAGKNITSVQPTVDEINRSLKSYGFTNFKIVPSPAQPNAYQIQRMDGTLATNTLSEGEETFISFLYFLQFAKGSVDVAKISNRKVLVLDDPICSLDSTVLYIVSSLVKGLIKDVREGNSDVEQIFILTHNVFFHKETAFIDRRTEVCNDIHFWIISKDNNISSIKAYERNNPIKTSYELLWEELKSNTNASLITTQNIMRRILENYFSILGKTKDDTIVDSFSTIEEKMICRSLLSWINDGSHTIPDDLYIDSYTDSIDRYKQIFKEVFFKMGHEAHYKMMMGEP